MQISQTGSKNQQQHKTKTIEKNNRISSIFRTIRNRLHSGKQNNGFSLMEIMLVFAIIAVLSSISMPAMRGFAASRRLKTSAQAIADTLTFARDMAITEKTTHLVVFDIDTNRYWLASSETFDIQNPIASAGRTANPTVSNGEQTFVSRTSGIMGIPQPLSNGISIAILVTSHNGVTQRIAAGADFVYFSPTSTSANTIVYLQNVKGSVIAVAVEGTTGRASIHHLSDEQIQSVGLSNDL